MTTATLTITKCGECPHHKVGNSYSIDGWDRGEDWTCGKTGKPLAGFVERPSDEPHEVPTWCPLIKKPRKK